MTPWIRGGLECKLERVRLLRERGDHAGALEILASIQPRTPESDKRLLRETWTCRIGLADRQFVRSRFDGAAQAYSEALSGIEKTPTSVIAAEQRATILWREARCYTELGDIERLAGTIEKIQTLPVRFFLTCPPKSVLAAVIDALAPKAIEEHVATDSSKPRVALIAMARILFQGLGATLVQDEIAKRGEEGVRLLVAVGIQRQRGVGEACGGPATASGAAAF